MALYKSSNVDAEYSSGDSNNIKSKQYQEENNNNIDELSKHLSEMGCIVDAVKRPPNTCMETCVYEEPNERLNKNNISSVRNDVSNEDNYSDEFEEESTSDKEVSNTQPQELSKSTDTHKVDKPSLKLSKSCSGNFSKPPSISARSSDFGSSSTTTRSHRRVNMSFSNDRLRDIDRHNHILLNKILSARNSKKSSIPPRDRQVWRPVPTAAVHRKVQQMKIDHENMILLKKIQRAKSSSCSVRR